MLVEAVIIEDAEWEGLGMAGLEWAGLVVYIVAQ